MACPMDWAVILVIQRARSVVLRTSVKMSELRPPSSSLLGGMTDDFTFGEAEGQRWVATVSSPWGWWGSVVFCGRNQSPQNGWLTNLQILTLLLTWPHSVFWLKRRTRKAPEPTTGIWSPAPHWMIQVRRGGKAGFAQMSTFRCSHPFQAKWNAASSSVALKKW